MTAAIDALRAVFAVHDTPKTIRPVDEDGVQYPPVQVCHTCGTRWPCETLNLVGEAIDRVLDEHAEHAGLGARTDEATIKAPPPQTRMGAMIHEGPIRVRLCDDAGMVSHQRVEPGSPGTIFDPDLTYLKLLNNLRAKNRDPDAQVPYTGEPFVCTGSAHLAGQAFVCVNPIHANAAARLDEGSATPDNLSDLSLSSVSAEGSATPDQGKGEPR